MEVDTNCKIPLRNKKKEIVGYAIVDPDMYEELMHFSWHLNKGGYPVSGIGRMSRYIMKPNIHEIIDHINHDRLDHRKCNLRVATYSQNNQNKTKKHGTFSKYIGVCKGKGETYSSEIKFQGKKYHLGLHVNEIDAAHAYDLAAIKFYGTGAQINNVIPSEAFQEYKPKIRSLPTYVYERKNGFCVIIKQQGSTLINKLFYKLDDAINERNRIIETINEETENYFKSLPVQRNEQDVAFIPLSNSKEVVLVDDNIYHALIRTTWQFRDGYASGKINGRLQDMHVYIYNLEYGVDKQNDIRTVVDHINRKPLDNRVHNLRRVCCGINNHNKTKNQYCTSRFSGVTKLKSGSFTAVITYQKTHYYLGTFKEECAAAFAYNVAGKHLYGEFAKLNDVPVPDNYTIKGFRIMKIKNVDLDGSESECEAFDNDEMRSN